MLENYLPKQYWVDNAFVLGCEGRFNDQSLLPPASAENQLKVMPVQIIGQDEYKEVFGLAEPNEEFAVYSESEWKRVK